MFFGIYLILKEKKITQDADFNHQTLCLDIY